MDLDKALRDLYEEKKRLDRAISRLEARLSSLQETHRRSTRGRKGMGPEERLKVSARMTAYWASRRAKGGPVKELKTETQQEKPQTEPGSQTGAGAA